LILDIYSGSFIPYVLIGEVCITETLVGTSTQFPNGFDCSDGFHFSHCTSDSLTLVIGPRKFFTGQNSFDSVQNVRGTSHEKQVFA
jgi:hypothetical protein